ncbi:MAG: sirohydrochlorin cobaltochelatase [Firmicutes bacterium]|nr:sirohydrochlorin cobaltochelatase [Bacillota bacterium]
METLKKSLLILLALGLLLSLTALAGCAPATTPDDGSAQTDDEATSDEGTEDAVKPVLLAVSFGTSYNDSRDITIGAVEEALQKAYPDYEVRRAFTSQIIIDILAERENLEIDNVTEAMDRLVADGVKEVVVQPTHVMPGFEYDDIVAEVSAYADQFDSLKIGVPLLTEDADFDALIKVLTEETAEYANDDTAIVFMGHGTEHESNAVYAKLQEKITAAGYDNYFIGTVEATPSVDDVLALVQESGATKVVLTPLMIVAGDHANNDMAGDEEDSWKSIFTAAGFDVECLLKGLGQYKGVQDMIVAHAAATMEK